MFLQSFPIAGYDFWYDQYSMATYITYELLVNLKDTTNVGSDYGFSLDTRVGSQTTTHSITISAADVDTAYAAQNILPDISLVHSVGTNNMNIFGSEWVELNIYVPPGTQDDFTINIYAPYDAANYGELPSHDIAFYHDFQYKLLVQILSPSC